MKFLLAITFISAYTQDMLGNIDGARFAALFTMAISAAIFKFYLEVKDRDIQSPNTPVNFRIKFMFLDNLPRMIATVFGIAIFIRFQDVLLPFLLSLLGLGSVYNYIKENQISDMLVAVLVGFFFDYISQMLKEKLGWLRVNRDKIFPPAEKPMTYDATPPYKQTNASGNGG